MPSGVIIPIILPGEAVDVVRAVLIQTFERCEVQGGRAWCGGSHGPGTEDWVISRKILVKPSGIADWGKVLDRPLEGINERGVGEIQT